MFFYFVLTVVAVSVLFVLLFAIRKVGANKRPEKRRKRDGRKEIHWYY